MAHWRWLGAALSSVALTCGCSSASMPPRSRPSTAAATVASGSPSRPMTPVRLVAAPAELTTECAAAAHRLGFAVPCPTLVPTIGARPASCPAPQGVMPAPCVGYEGVTFNPIFFMELNGFDVPADYVGVDRKPQGHLIVEARRHRDSPPLPCIGGKRLADIRLTRVTAEQFICPPDSAVVQREAMHGEGAFAGHLLLLWDLAGVDYLVSAHSNSTVNRQLLQRLGNSATFVQP